MPGQTERISSAIFILYVDDQDRCTDFYRRVLKMEPSLYVAGMTEFAIDDNFALGLMPEKPMKELLGLTAPEPASGRDRASRSEVYLRVDDPATFHRRAIACGAIELSPLSERHWGDMVAYSLDPAGHVLAFAKPIDSD